MFDYFFFILDFVNNFSIQWELRFLDSQDKFFRPFLFVLCDEALHWLDRTVASETRLFLFPQTLDL